MLALEKWPMRLEFCEGERAGLKIIKKHLSSLGPLDQKELRKAEGILSAKNYKLVRLT